MRKITLLLVGLLLGLAAGTLGWQAAFAADPLTDTLVVCQRPGADLRSPAANGTCPSGYTKTEISETPPTPPGTVTQYHAAETVSGDDIDLLEDIVSLELPAGAYTVFATGGMSGADRANCALYGNNQPLDNVQLYAPASNALVKSAMSGYLVEKGSVQLAVRCDYLSGQNLATSQLTWKLTATKVDTLIRQ